jgi:hypothetical protein
VLNTALTQKKTYFWSLFLDHLTFSLNLMWKTFSWIAAVLAIGAAVLSHGNAKALKTERALKSISEENVTLAKAKFGEWSKSLASHVTVRKATDEAVLALANEAAVLKSKVDEVTKEVEAKKVDLQDLSAKLAEAKKKEDDLGGLEAMVSKLKELKAQQSDNEAAVGALKTQVAVAAERKTQTDSEIAHLRQKEAWVAKGWMNKSFTSVVTAVDNTWGFCVLGAGSNNGVISGATLDVKRGGQVVGKVKVTNLEANRAVADVVKELGQEVLLQPGDSLVVNDESAGENQQVKSDADAAKAAAVAAAAPAADLTAGVPAPVAPAADPFAAPPADPAAPAADAAAPAADPFK